MRWKSRLDQSLLAVYLMARKDCIINCEMKRNGWQRETQFYGPRDGASLSLTLYQLLFCLHFRILIQRWWVLSQLQDEPKTHLFILPTVGTLWTQGLHSVLPIASLVDLSPSYICSQTPIFVSLSLTLTFLTFLILEQIERPPRYMASPRYSLGSGYLSILLYAIYYSRIKTHLGCTLIFKSRPHMV